MTKDLKVKLSAIGLPLLIVIFLVALSFSSPFQNATEGYSIAILLDLLITVPIIYFFGIRKTTIPKFTILYVFLIGILVAGFIIPTAQQGLLNKIKFIAIPLLELGILSVLIYKIISLKKSFQNNQSTENDFYDNLLIASKEIFPNRIASVLSTEVSMFYYLFSKNKNKTLKTNEFTYFKKSGVKTVIGVFLMLVVVEVIVVHLLVDHWNYTKLAWVLSGIGAYAFLQILAILRSMNQRLIYINLDTKTLHLRFGIATQSSISIKDIERIELSKKQLPDNKMSALLSPFDLLDPHNVIIHTNKAQLLQKVYGLEKNYQTIGVFIDEKELFVKAIAEIMANQDDSFSSTKP